MQRITGLVDEIVARYPGVVLIAGSNLPPQPDDAVLEVFVVPEGGVVAAVVAMPVWVLTTWEGVQVEDRVDFVLCAQIYHSIEMLEAFGFEHAGVHVVFEVAVVEWQTETVETGGGEEGGVFLGEEVF